MPVFVSLNIQKMELNFGKGNTGKASVETLCGILNHYQMGDPFVVGDKTFQAITMFLVPAGYLG
jgi:hypothetical protein